MTTSGDNPEIPPDLQAAFTADRRLRFAVPVDDALIRDWVRVVGADHDPRTLGRRLFDVPGHTHALTVTEVGPGRIVVEALGTRIVVAHPDSGPSFESARTLDREASWIHMDFTRVAPALQGRGIGTTLAGNGYRLARSLGFSRLGVTAVDHGACVWAHAGFVPTHASWNRDGGVKSCIAARLASLRGHIRWETVNLVYTLLGADDPMAIWVVSDLEEPVPSRLNAAARVPLGWALLAESGATWRGILAFEAEAADARARDYLRIMP